ncbi:MAG: diacylglycerol kinase family protein [Devosia sp.]
MQTRRFHILLNPKSGAALALGLTAETLSASFAANGHDATIDADDSAPFADRIQRAIDSDADVIVSAGGDGTATALAGALADTGKALAVLPLGTANLLARDLALPLDLDATVAALADMQPRLIDVGEVNGRVFLHKVVVGLIPSIAAGREHIRSRQDLPALIGFLGYFIRRLTRARRMALSIASAESGARLSRVQAIAVANNAYDEGFGRIFSRTRLDTGRLTLYTLSHLTFGDVIRLSAEMIAGRWQADEALTIESVTSASIRARNPTLQVMIDGEVEIMSTPLEFRIRPLALTVLAPVAVVLDAEIDGEPGHREPIAVVA